MTNKILAVDDDEIIIEILKGTLSKKYEIISTTSSKEALKLFKEDPALIVILDLNMPEISGKDLMAQIFDAGYKPVVIILTAQTDVNIAVELFKLGAYDYLVKPFNPTEMMNRVDKAFEIAELRILNENIQKEREIRIEHQLNWNLFKENLIKKDSDRTDSGLMTSINSSLIQGAGLGTLAPLVQMIQASSKLEGSYYLVEKDLLEMLFENTKFSNKLIFMIGDIDYIINNELPKESLTISEIYKLIESTVSDLADYQNLRNNIIKLASDTFSKNNRKIRINPEYFQKAIQELLFNALKFSEASSKIYILFEVVREEFHISVLNTPAKDTKEQNGIPSEYQNIIFEPFFRISRLVYDAIPTLDFGLGLCFVEKIIRNHEGKIRVVNLKNSLDNAGRVLVNFDLELPFEKQ
ncbi:MAG TPA: response regulator [Leptospiraceae bacterium]|nr:response regulator [Leptospiraceae bacterium]HMX31142.1 response regulator [Leptospiraceae bacterium]HMY30670.1 response regulator [Leptospiraceae bacterium]HNL70849.1 response regulator [Leptospiraceae bacterium]HNM89504.1 response regulator [Leptospiraceae bacterium]